MMSNINIVEGHIVKFTFLRNKVWNGYSAIFLFRSALSRVAWKPENNLSLITLFIRKYFIYNLMVLLTFNYFQENK